MRYLTSIYIYVSILFIPSVLYSQEKIIGIWKGELFQDPNKVFYFEIKAESADEHGNITGTTFIQSISDDLYLDKKGDYATISFEGKFVNGILYFQEKNILKQQKNNSFYWCIKKGELAFHESENEYILKGKWNSNSCSPGEILLKKEIQAEDCIKKKMELWSTKGKFEKTEDYIERTSQTNKKKMLLTYLHECICAGINLKSAKNSYNADLEYFDITLPDFSSFRLYVPISEAPDFDQQFKNLIIDSVQCDFNLKNNGYEVEYIRLIDKHNDKTYTYQTDKLTNNINKLADRKIDITKKIEVSSNSIQIELWDNNIEDGDIISLFLNDILILENYKVKKQRETLAIYLKDGKNVIVLHAINLGTQPPNTAAISINDGNEKNIIILSSDMNTSEAIEIIKKK